jgi:cold shock CspA family protein
MIEQTRLIPNDMEYVLSVGKHFFYALMLDGKRYGTVALRPGNRECQIHMRFIKFSHKTLREGVKDWERIKQIIKGFGCSHIVAITSDLNNDVFFKFIGRFGFGQPKILAVSSMEV